VISLPWWNKIKPAGYSDAEGSDKLPPLVTGKYNVLVALRMLKNFPKICQYRFLP
jgi:hypothetical protein